MLSEAGRGVRGGFAQVKVGWRYSADGCVLRLRHHCYMMVSVDGCFLKKDRGSRI